jgi:hypothetical protein
MKSLLNNSNTPTTHTGTGYIPSKEPSGGFWRCPLYRTVAAAAADAVAGAGGYG